MMGVIWHLDKAGIDQKNDSPLNTPDKVESWAMGAGVTVKGTSNGCDHFS
jgi:hypothetical protein